MKRFAYSLILISALLLLSALGLTGVSAYADTPIGTQHLEVSLYNTVYNYYSGRDEDGDRGKMQYLVKCDPETDELTYTVDNFIDAETTVDVSKQLQNYIPVNSVSVLYRWVIVAFSQNCDVTFYALLNKGDTENEYTDEIDLHVTKIDNKAPKISSLVLAENMIGAGLKYNVTVTDNQSDVQLTARSGIYKIIVYHYNPSVGVDFGGTTKEITNALKAMFTPVQEKTYDSSSVATSQTVQFVADDNGWYLLYMSDQLNNNTYTSLFKYTESPQFNVSLDFGFGYEPHSMDGLVSECETLLEEESGKINVDIYNNLKASLQSFIVACQINDTEANIRKAYFALKAAKTDFSAATVTIPEPEFINEELLDGDIRVINLGAVTSLLPGDRLELGGIITSYTASDLSRFAYRDVLELAGIDNPDKVIYLSAKLIKNDIQCIPRVAMIYQIEFPADAEIALIASVDGAVTFSVKEISRDGNTVQFSSSAHSEELFFVIKYAESGMDNGLLIGLSAGAAGLVVIIVVIFILIKNGVIKTGKGSKQMKPRRKDEDKDAKDDLFVDDTLEKYRGKDIE